MARKVFFSFHYDDIFRVNQVRNSWLTKGDSAGYIDKAEFEKVERQGQLSIERWIDNQLKGTTVTVVLIGSNTAGRPYVGYEIKQSHAQGNGLLGIYIHRLNSLNMGPSVKGANPLSNWHIQQSGRTVLLSDIYPTYDWVSDDGYQNLGRWVESAAQAARR